MKLDGYMGAGFALELLAQSKYHRQYTLRDYFRTEILPAFWTEQFRFYLTDEGSPTAMITWAWINEETERDLHQTGRSLKESEWKSGNRLFFNDWVSPYGGLRHLVRDMFENVFPYVDHATSLRRNPDGSVRRINHWRHPEVRRSQQGQRR